MAMDWRYWQERHSSGAELEPDNSTPLAKHLLATSSAHQDFVAHGHLRSPLRSSRRKGGSPDADQSGGSPSILARRERLIPGAGELGTQPGFLPAVGSPIKSGYGSGNMNAPRERAAQWPSHKQHNPMDNRTTHNASLTSSAYRIEGSLSEGRVLGNRSYLGPASTMHSTHDHDQMMMTVSLERAAIKAIKAREDILQRVAQMASKLDTRTAEAMGYLSTMVPAVRLFFRMVNTLRMRTVEVVETISAWHRTSDARRPFIWQGEDYLLRMGPDLAFLTDVQCLKVRLPSTSPEQTDPFLATMTPDGVPLDEPTARIGSSRKGGEGHRVAAARRILHDMYPPPKPQPEQMDIRHHHPTLPPIMDNSPVASPRASSARLAPMSPRSQLGGSPRLLSPRPPSSRERLTGGLLTSPSGRGLPKVLPPVSPEPVASPRGATHVVEDDAGLAGADGWPLDLQVASAPAADPTPLEGVAPDGAPFDIGLPESMVAIAMAQAGFDVQKPTGGLSRDDSNSGVGSSLVEGLGPLGAERAAAEGTEERDELTVSEEPSLRGGLMVAAVEESKELVDDDRPPTVATAAANAALDGLLDDVDSADDHQPGPNDERPPTVATANANAVVDDLLGSIDEDADLAPPKQLDDERAVSAHIDFDAVPTTQLVRLELSIEEKSEDQAMRQAGASLPGSATGYVNLQLHFDDDDDGSGAPRLDSSASRASQTDPQRKLRLVEARTPSTLRPHTSDGEVTLEVTVLPSANNKSSSSQPRSRRRPLPSVLSTRRPSDPRSFRRPSQGGGESVRSSRLSTVSARSLAAIKRPVQLELSVIPATGSIPANTRMTDAEIPSSLYPSERVSVELLPSGDDLAPIMVSMAITPPEEGRVAAGGDDSGTTEVVRITLTVPVVMMGDAADCFIDDLEAGEEGDDSDDELDVQQEQITDPPVLRPTSPWQAVTWHQLSRVDTTVQRTAAQAAEQLRNGGAGAAAALELLRNAENAGDEHSPDVALAAAVAGVALQVEGDYSGAMRALQHSLSLHRAWLGLGSTATAAVQILLDAVQLLTPGVRGLSKERGRAILDQALAEHGPDSLPVGELTARVSWLFYLSGETEAAVGSMADARRVLFAWHGPEHSMVEATEGLLKQMQSGGVAGVVAPGDEESSSEEDEKEGEEEMGADTTLQLVRVRIRVNRESSRSGGAEGAKGNRPPVTWHQLARVDSTLQRTAVLAAEALSEDGGGASAALEQLRHAERVGRYSPEVAMAAAVAGVALQVEGDLSSAQRTLQHSLSLHRAWLGLGSTATAVVQILLDSLALLKPGERGMSPEDAAAVVDAAISESGPDSLAVGDAAARTGWLLYLSGHTEEAVSLMRTAQRVLHAWHGPNHPLAEAAGGLLKQMRSGSLDRALHLVPPAASQPNAPARPKIRATLTVVDDHLPTSTPPTFTATSIPTVRASLVVLSRVDDGASEFPATTSNSQPPSRISDVDESPHALANESTNAPAVSWRALISGEQLSVASLPAPRALALLTNAYDCDGADSPSVALAATRAGIALMVEGDVASASRTLALALRLHRAWLGPNSPVTLALTTVEATLELCPAPAITPQLAKSLVTETIKATGSDSLQVGEHSMAVGWLLHLAGHASEAEGWLREGKRLMNSWHGPKSPELQATELLLRIVSGMDDSGPRGVRASTIVAHEPQQVPPSRISDVDKSPHALANESTNAPAVSWRALISGEQLSVASLPAPRALALLTDAYDRDGADSPSVALAAARAGIALMVEGDVASASRKLALALRLHRAWLGPSSPVTLALTTVEATLELCPAPAITPQLAKSLVTETIKATGPDSMQVGEHSMAVGWLLHLAGHASEAEGWLREGKRLMNSWHGPKSPEVQAAELLLRIVSGMDDSGPRGVRASTIPTTGRDAESGLVSTTLHVSENSKQPVTLEVIPAGDKSDDGGVELSASLHVSEGEGRPVRLELAPAGVADDGGVNIGGNSRDTDNDGPLSASLLVLENDLVHPVHLEMTIDSAASLEAPSAVNDVAGEEVEEGSSNIGRDEDAPLSASLHVSEGEGHPVTLELTSNDAGGDECATQVLPSTGDWQDGPVSATFNVCEDNTAQPVSVELRAKDADEGDDEAADATASMTNGQDGPLSATLYVSEDEVLQPVRLELIPSVVDVVPVRCSDNDSGDAHPATLESGPVAVELRLNGDLVTVSLALRSDGVGGGDADAAGALPTEGRRVDATTYDAEPSIARRSAAGEDEGAAVVVQLNVGNDDTEGSFVRVEMSTVSDSLNDGVGEGAEEVGQD